MIINRTSPGINKPYEPLLWNDTGVYSYFYIDFLKDLSMFTIGMWNESVVVYDSVPVTVTAVERISASVYKIYANITNFTHGYTVLHKKTTRLTLTDGSTLGAFSIHAFVTGQIMYLDGGYIYENLEQSFKGFTSATESNTSALCSVEVCGATEPTILNPYQIVVTTEHPTITLI